MQTYNIAFAGSGISTTLTLIELLSKVLVSESASGTLRIAVVEKKNELWVGVPYGSRSSVNSLSITCAHDFIYEHEREPFFKWLKENRAAWTAHYGAQGGEIGLRWIEKNKELLDKEDWETIYIPRFTYGMYLLQKLDRLINEVQQRNLAEITTLHGEVTDLEILENIGYKLIFKSSEHTLGAIAAHKVVMAIGSPPAKSWAIDHCDDVLYINDIYEPGEIDNIGKIVKKLGSTKLANDRNILIVGSNASAIELTYLLEGDKELRQFVNKIVVISPSGIFPYPISEEMLDAHPTPSLDVVTENADYSLDDLMSATLSDIKLALKNGANVDYIATIVNATIQHLDKLGEDAKGKFIGLHGMSISRLIRRAGPEYKKYTQGLVDNKDVILLKGRFKKGTPFAENMQLTYHDTETGSDMVYPLHFAAVINCGGSEDLDCCSSPLIRNVINRGLGLVNISGKGFEVNEKFEAARHLYVMGPLLGGNMNKLIHFWHLENAPRISYLAPHLANILLQGE